METDIVRDFMELFAGRGDAYGDSRGFCRHESLTASVYAKHLTSPDVGDHIGVYGLIGEQCSYGCVDIDGKDFPIEVGPMVGWDWEHMFELAKRIRACLLVEHCFGYIERTKNGYHVWVFPHDRLMSAAIMRRALMVCCLAAGFTPKEVNPKAEGPRPGTKGLGNFVRLCYGGSLADGYDINTATRVMVELDGSPIPLDSFLERVMRTQTGDLERLARLWTPPETLMLEITPVELTKTITDQMNGLAYRIWSDGPLAGHDRSSTLAKLAHKCRDSGLDANDAMAVLVSADQRWGRFHQRDDGMFQLQRMIETAF